MIVESFGGGVGRHCVDLVLGLHDLGHEVHLIYSAGRVDLGTTAGLAAIQTKRIPTYQVSMKSRPDSSDLAAIKEIRSYIKQHGPFDVVHGQSSKGGALARLARPPYPAVVVYTPHAIATMSPTRSGLSRKILGAVEKHLARKTDAIICVSPDEEQHIIHLGISPGLLYTVINGIAMGPDPTATKPKVVGFVGRFEEQKHPENLLKAFASAGMPDWRLAMVGYGPLEQELKSFVTQLGIGASVDWLGNQNGAEAMRGFGIFCLPSRYEAMPYVLLEALAAGLPIVSTQCGGATTTITDGVNGLIVPIEDSTALANALKQVMGDEHLRLRMGENSLQRAAEFSLEAMVNNTIKVYEDVIDKKRVGSR